MNAIQYHPVTPRFFTMASKDREIEIAASNMLDRYGVNALREIDLRILELESRNQPEAVRLWRAIREKVELSMNPASGKRRDN